MSGPSLDPITVMAATQDTASAVERMLGGDGAGGCWCLPWRGTPRTPGETRRDLMLRLLRDPEPPPGFLAFVDDQVVGWVGVTTPSRAPRLRRSRVIPRVDALEVWCIGCFVVRPGRRRRGVASALLEGVISAARRAGAPAIEAYPIDPDSRVGVGAGYVGFASMFEARGFRRVAITAATSGRLPRILMRLPLDATAAGPR